MLGAAMPLDFVNLSQPLVDAAGDRSRVAGLTHQFYKYPARFSPTFVRAAISEFTGPGDIVADPFMGGGTTAVEALAAGRRVVATDTSGLAHFVAETKTTPLRRGELTNVVRWAEALADAPTAHLPVRRPSQWIEAGYQRNLTGADLWPIRKTIEVALDRLDDLEPGAERRLARAIVLRTAQGALDTRNRFPKVARFREALRVNAARMTSAIAEFDRACRAARRGAPPATQWKSLRLGPASSLPEERMLDGHAPRLVLTSPPYPGVHVLYHRWQVRGGRETPAPFWIADVLDGAAGSHYTLADRHDEPTYFAQLEASFRAIRDVCDSRTIVLQLVAFRSLSRQLPLYLEAMQRAGFVESLSQHGRLTRDVPNRRWYARAKSLKSDSSREVVLLHQLCP